MSCYLLLLKLIIKIEIIDITNFLLSIDSTLVYIANPAFYFVDDSTYSTNTVSTPSVIIIYVTSFILFLMSNSKTIFYYDKPIIINDYTSSKLLIKKTIWIRKIMFIERINV